MRIVQLARKLKIKTSVIIDFLKEKGIQTALVSNSKIDEEYVELVVENFGDLEEWKKQLALESDQSLSDISEESTQESNIVDQSEEVVEETLSTEPIQNSNEEKEAPIADIQTEVNDFIEDTEPKKEIIEESVQEITASEAIVPPPSQESSNIDETVNALDGADVVAEGTEKTDEENTESEEALDYENAEVIKAPKVSLPGLKVVGKIDLPEPKPKEEKEPSEAPEERTSKKGRKKGKKNKKKDGEWVNVIEKQRQKAKEQQQRNEEILQKQLKKKKTNHYLQKVESTYQVSSTGKKKKIKPKKQTSRKSVEKKKSLVKRFLHWLNT